MSQETDRLDLAKVAMDTFLGEGKIDQSTYFKEIVTLAHGWIELGDKERAVDLISALSPKYNDLRLPDQMRDDPTFRAQALAVAKALRPDIGDESEAEIDLLMLRAPTARA